MRKLKAWEAPREGKCRLFKMAMMSIQGCPSFYRCRLEDCAEARNELDAGE